MKGGELAENKKLEKDNVKADQMPHHDIESTMMGKEHQEKPYQQKPQSTLRSTFKALPLVPELKGPVSTLAQPRKPLLERLAHSRKSWKAQTPKKRERKCSVDFFWL